MLDNTIYHTLRSIFLACFLSLTWLHGSHFPIKLPSQGLWTCASFCLGYSLCRLSYDFCCFSFSDSANGKESTCQCRRCKRRRLNPWVGKIPWRRKWQPTPEFFPGKFHGQRSLAGCSPWGLRESVMTQWDLQFLLLIQISTKIWYSQSFPWVGISKLWPNSCPLTLFIIKFYWNTVMPNHWFIINDWLHTVIAEFSS